MGSGVSEGTHHENAITGPGEEKSGDTVPCQLLTLEGQKNG